MTITHNFFRFTYSIKYLKIMRFSRTDLGTMLIFSLIYCNAQEVKSKSIKIRTSKPKTNLITHHLNYYPRVKVQRPLQLSPIAALKRQDEVFQQFESGSFPSSNEVSQDPIQSTFNTGLRGVFQYLQKFASRFFDSSVDNEDSGISNNENEEGKLRIPGLPTTSIFQSFDVSSIVRLLEATDGSQAEVLAEAALVDIVSQLVNIIGFNDLRDWLGIILMYFVLGPILIPLFWLPISLFGMAGLLAPLFFFNPPSKLNTDITGHDPILPERETARFGELRSLESFLGMFTTSAMSKQVPPPPSSPGILESCMERVSCHLTRIYRDNPISQWLTSHFNTTKVEWARVLPEGDINENGISSWEDCKKYVCSVFPVA